MEKALLAAGCFWGVEEVFRTTNGIIDTKVGYSGGHKLNPTYEEVCTGNTDHAEVVKVEYDESVITYDQILNIFFENHNPTQLNRQGKILDSWENATDKKGNPLYEQTTIDKWKAEGYVPQSPSMKSPGLFGMAIKAIGGAPLSYDQLMNEFNQGWEWDFPEAVFQSGVELVEFKRMYLMRCLYRRSGSTKIFLGWKVQLLKDFTSSEIVENPFWDLSRKEEKLLENVLKKAGFFSRDEYLHSNTAEKERKRRFEFQKEIEKLYI